MKDKKVLIVDFDDKSIGPLTKFLEDEGFEVLVERDGEAGLETAKKQNPDLVILEPMLPKLHGFELCSIITHDLEPKIPVIILTKFYREEQFKIESVRSFGASAFVSKPFQGLDMRELIKNILVADEAGKSEADPLTDMEIPDALSDDALTDLQPGSFEDLQKEEVKVIAHENPRIELPKSVSEGLQKKEKTQERGYRQDFDAILQDTLTEFTQKKTEVEPAPEAKVAMDDPFLSFIPDAKPAVQAPKFESIFPDLMPAEPEERIPQDEAVFSFEDLHLPKTESQVSVPELAAMELDLERIETPAPQLEPEDDNGTQDAIFLKFDKMAQAAQPPKSQEEPTSAAPESESPEEVLRQAEAVTQTLEKELEIKVTKMVEKESEPADEFSKQEKTERNKKKTESENSKALADETDGEKPAAKEKAVEIPARPELKDVVAREDMFAGFGSPEETKTKPNIIQAILSKIKGTPTKYIIPFAAVFMIVLVSLVFMIPKLSQDAPVEQASLGVTLEGQAKSPSEEITSDPFEAIQGDSQDTTATPPLTPEQEEDPASDPVESPEPKPEPKSTPPPSLPLVEEELGSPQVKSQLLGDTRLQQNQNLSTEPSREQSQSTEAQPTVQPPAAKQETLPPAKENPGNTETTDPVPNKAETELAPVMKRMPDKAKQGDIVSIKAVDTEPEIIQKELPRYPAAAKGRGISGTVLINTLISENGDVLQTVVTRKINSSFGFNEAAERAVKKWKFRPAWKDGVRVKVWKTIPIGFRDNTD
jgi:TonB family protein